MDKFGLAQMLCKSKPVDRVDYIQKMCKDKNVLDLGCVRHNADFSLNNPNWLHQKIKDVAKHVLGVDYMEDEVKKLKDRGYNIIAGDVTKPIPLIKDKFDIIVAGDLIEHLDNFDGFFTNCTKWLVNHGFIIVTTCNPFYHGEFNYVSIKNKYFTNPEHTCWIDPLSLKQLSNRHLYSIADIRFIKDSWNLGHYISESSKNQYDVIYDKWLDQSFKSRLSRKIGRVVFGTLYSIGSLFYRGRKLVRYSDYIAVLF